MLDTPVKPRGIVIIDGTELMTSAIAYPHAAPGSSLHHLDPKTETYMDILPLLAQHGVRVVVPEMVAAETAEFLRGNYSVSRAFSESGHALKPLNEKIKQFLLGSSGPGRPVEFSEADLRTPYGQYIGQLLDTQRSISQIAGSVQESSSIGDTYRRHKILSITQQAGTEHFGEMHAIDIIEAEIRKQRREHTSTPIFFFSADNDARELLRTRIEAARREGDPEVNLLTLAGLLDALGEDRTADAKDIAPTNALQELGLQPEAQTHWQAIRTQGSECGQRLPTNIRQSNDYQDIPLIKRGDDSTRNFPFRQAVAGLAQELAEERVAKAAARSELPKLDRAAKFRERQETAKRHAGNTTGTAR